MMHLMCRRRPPRTTPFRQPDLAASVRALTPIDRVEHYLRSRYWRVAEDQRETLWEHLCYIGNNKARMRYVTLRLAGLPVGSGVTESTCKTVIGHRTKRSGQRWRADGLL
jgi:hypothetical protein